MLATEADAYRKDNRFYQEIRWALGDGLLNSQDGGGCASGASCSRCSRAGGSPATRARWPRRPRRCSRARLDRGPDGRPARARCPCSPCASSAGCCSAPTSSGRCRSVAPAFPILGEHARNRAYNPVRHRATWPTPANRRAAAGQRRRLRGLRRPDRGAPRERRRRRGPARPADRRARRRRAADDVEVRDQVLIFLLAGHDTTAIALTFALHLLGRHPDVQARVQAEVDDGRSASAPRARRTSSGCRTPTMVLKEAMRLYPPGAGASGRRAPTGDEIGGVDAPARRRRASSARGSRTAIPSSGRSPSASTPSASRPSARPSATATPTSPSAPARARASASTSRCSRR